jgi:tungstate transport system permease protein
MDFLLDGLTQAVRLLTGGDAETYSAIMITLQVSTLSMLCSLLIGIPLGFSLGHFEFPGKKPLRTLVDTLMALPTVFIGLLVYAFLTHRGPLGHFGLLFTLPGIAIGQTILALPIVIGLTATAIESMEEKTRVTILSVGISMMVGGNIKWQTRTITTAIALETNKGQFGMGVALGLVLLAIAFGVNLSVSFLRRKT